MRRLPRAAALGALGLAASLLGVALFVCASTELRLRRRYEACDASIDVSRDAAAVERGRHLAHGVAQCAFCHGADLGGKVAADDPWLGRLYASNLTSGRGGVGPLYTDAELACAIRRGVGRDRRSLALMPSEYFHVLGERDLAAIIAYLRSLPPVDAAWPERKVGPFTRVALAFGLAPELLTAERIDHADPPEPAPRPAASAEYGAYLVEIGACRVCHRDDLRGGLHPLSLPGEPPPPPLTPAGAVGRWDEVDFLRAMRTGRTPAGRRLDPGFMPWPWYAAMSDEELRAIWAYLRSLEVEGSARG